LGYWASILGLAQSQAAVQCGWRVSELTGGRAFGFNTASLPANDDDGADNGDRRRLVDFKPLGRWEERGWCAIWAL
jgi:hypothetical protein